MIDADYRERQTTEDVADEIDAEECAISTGARQAALVRRIETHYPA